MNTSLTKLLRSRLVQTGGLLAVVAAVAVSIAWSDRDQGRGKLAGTWVGKNGDITWTSTYSPDCSGQNATITLQWITVSADFEMLDAQLGADAGSFASGYMSMIDRHTATGKMIWYEYASGTPSMTLPVVGQIKAIAVMENELHFTSPTTALGTHVLRLYQPDPQNPMVPNEAYRFFEQTYNNVPHVKIF
jgi:hypothetical protein